MGGGFEIFRYVINFGQPNNNNSITINFAEPIDQDVFNSRRTELDYGNYDHKVSHVLFGDTGFLLDPYYDSKVIIYDDVI